MVRQPQSRHRHSKIDQTVLAAIIGAIGTVGGVIAGALLGNSGVLINVLPGNPTKVITASPAAQPTVTETVTVQTPAPSTPPSGSPAASTSNGIYHQGSLFLTGDSFDLDAPPSDHQWGSLQLAPGDQTDITGVGDTNIELLNGAQGVQLGPGTGNSCFTASGYSTTGFGYNNMPIRVGQQLCVHTEEGRFSLLKVVALPSNGIQLYVTTYNQSAS